MKKSMFFLPLLAIFLGATVALAFQGKVTPKLVGMEWKYDEVNGTDPTDPSFYDPGSVDPCPDPTGDICAIVAPDDPNLLGLQPLIAGGLESRILSKDISQEDVYLRN